MRGLLTIFFSLITLSAFSQTMDSLVVPASGPLYRPTVWTDGGGDVQSATVLEITSSDKHSKAVIKYNTKTVGAQGQYYLPPFLSVEINAPFGNTFIGKIMDENYGRPNITLDHNLIVWLLPGKYYYKSSHSIQVRTFPSGIYYSSQGPFNSVTMANSQQDLNKNGITYDKGLYLISENNNYIAGNLGVGVINPAEKFAVNGTIRAKEIKVEAENWPDYVFHDSYGPMPLDSLEVFIKEYKHLPDVPSAESVANNGVNLGEMNKILLRKLEEVTLYLIQQKKIISDQSNSISDLYNKLKTHK